MNAPVPRLALETAEVDTSHDPNWYRDAVIYQLNVKAFYDTNGDGIGDFKGVTAKLDYVKDLGVNTIWLMPFYPSPLRDDGYDIAEYKDVNPQFGTLAVVEGNLLAVFADAQQAECGVGGSDRREPPGLPCRRLRPDRGRDLRLVAPPLTPPQSAQESARQTEKCHESGSPGSHSGRCERL